MSFVPQSRVDGNNRMFNTNFNGILFKEKRCVSIFSKSPYEITHTLATQNKDTKDTISCYAKHIIGGFLDLGEKWSSGCGNRVGLGFTRAAAADYYLMYSRELGAYKSIIEKTIESLPFVDFTSLTETFETEFQKPLYSRSIFEPKVVGWKKHCIGRMIGNIATTYGESKPFFEILINSSGSGACNPFTCHVFSNEEELTKRSGKLAEMTHVPFDIAKDIYYSKDLLKPMEHYSQNSGVTGPNGKRLLEALNLLESKTINSQISGNCWLKQPMRCLLVSLYIEIVTEFKDKELEECWKEANKLYSTIQLSTAIPFVESLLKEYRLFPEELLQATKALEEKKNKIAALTSR